MVDVLEGKLFGIGVESFTVGSHEFYLAYAAKNHVGVCMDTGHYHPTESVVDKLSSVALLVDDLMLHISRGTVSYTHLDVYKRQMSSIPLSRA